MPGYMMHVNVRGGTVYQHQFVLHIDWNKYTLFMKYTYSTGQDTLMYTLVKGSTLTVIP